MSTLLLDLDTTTFQDLVDDARLSIPPLAPTWTDFNVSDPGIMLIELLAWNAEAQVYALGHIRQDERTAYAALMGVRPRGPRPAGGLVWPSVQAGAPNPWGGIALPAQCRVSALRGALPDFSLNHAVWLHGATLTRVAALSGGSTYDYTQINRRRNATYTVFGPAPVRGDRLVLGLSAYVPPAVPPSVAQWVSLGFRITNPAKTAARSLTTARFRAVLTQGASSRVLPVRQDTTLGLLQPGVLLIEWPADALASGAASTLTLELIAGELSPAPMVERVDLNVLDVLQQAQRHDSFPAGIWPDSQYPLTNPGVQFGDSSPPLTVSVSNSSSSVTWSEVDGIAASGPTDTVYTFDPVAGVVQFGNGINGVIPPANSRVLVGYWTCQGTAANVSGGLDWSVEGIAGPYGANLDPMTGGTDTDGLDDLQKRARLTLNQHMLITDQDLIDAANALSQLRVVRAEIVTGPNVRPGLRVLVLLRERAAGADPSLIAETPLWLEAAAEALRSRLTLGQTLRVIGPRYVPLTLSVAVAVGATSDRVTVAARVLQVLQSRLSLYSSIASPTTPWPLGATVDALSIRGWLQAVPGVVSVTSVTMSSGSASISGNSLQLPPTGLPLLSISAADITVTRVATGSAR